jgi:hypothetical protein
VRSVFPFGVFVYLQLESAVTGRARFLSCGSPGLRRCCPRTVEPYWLSSPSPPFISLSPRDSTLRSSGLRVERPGFEQRKRCGLPERSTSTAFGRHYRVLPQRLVVHRLPSGDGLSVDSLGKCLSAPDVPFGLISMRGKVTKRYGRRPRPAPEASPEGFGRGFVTSPKCGGKAGSAVGMGRLLPWGSVPFDV